MELPSRITWCSMGCWVAGNSGLELLDTVMVAMTRPNCNGHTACQTSPIGLHVCEKTKVFWWVDWETMQVAANSCGIITTPGDSVGLVIQPRCLVRCRVRPYHGMPRERRISA